MSMSVGLLDHYNVSTRNLADTVHFYEDVLGFMNGPRPPFDFPGAWLYSDGHPVLHLNDISPTDTPQRAEFRGDRPRRIWQPRLRRHEAAPHAERVPFRINQVPNSRRWQIFVTDPNNILIELNFDVATRNRRRGCKERGRPRGLAPVAFATFSAMKRGSAKAATCTSGVQYRVGKPPALR